jgi:hypothetical protein
MSSKSTIVFRCANVDPDRWKTPAPASAPAPASDVVAPPRLPQPQPAQPQPQPAQPQPAQPQPADAGASDAGAAAAAVPIAPAAAAHGRRRCAVLAWVVLPALLLVLATAVHAHVMRPPSRGLETMEESHQTLELWRAVKVVWAGMAFIATRGAMLAARWACRAALRVVPWPLSRPLFQALRGWA